ncbi:MAG: SDR family oxidoreductase [Flexilinea sp.]|nr:SDR family oxidoreductase [Flexilinea sp.]
MKRILVTGASGLLGLNFCTFFCQKHQLIGITNRTKLKGVLFQTVACDLLNEDPGEMLDRFKPDVALHCAALANIDECEKFPEKAAAINSIYPGRFASAARKRDIKFVHISTDAVFDGEDCGESGYKEDDTPNPVSRYAETKLQGEINVLDNDPEALIPRVNFYGWSTGGSRSLVEFFYNNLAAGNQVNGFRDVFFNTLYVHELADILDEMIGLNAGGIWHVFSAEHQSKYAFGVSVAEKFGFDPGLVRAVSWKDGGLTARRSPNLIMNTDKLQTLLGHELPGQQKCLDRFYQDTTAGLREQIRNCVCPNQERNENGNQDR